MSIDTYICLKTEVKIPNIFLWSCTKYRLELNRLSFPSLNKLCDIRSGNFYAPFKEMPLIENFIIIRIVYRAGPHTPLSSRGGWSFIIYSTPLFLSYSSPVSYFNHLFFETLNPFCARIICIRRSKLSSNSKESTFAKNIFIYRYLIIRNLVIHTYACIKFGFIYFTFNQNNQFSNFDLLASYGCFFKSCLFAFVGFLMCTYLPA